MLINATWVDFTRRLECTFSSVEYFLRRYPCIFTDFDIDKVNDEFLSYQTMVKEDIPEEFRKSIGLVPDEYYHVDLFWGYLKSMKKTGTNVLEFENLFKIANAVLTIPHSNAGEERIFSLINKNKTPSRNSLSLDGTLQLLQ